MANLSPSSKKAKPVAAAPKPAGGKPKTVTAQPKAAPKRKVIPRSARATAMPARATGVALTPGAKIAKSQAMPQVKASQVAKPAAEPKEKVKKPKLVRDSFTMPEEEYQVLGAVKKACLKAGVAVKKSELLRVGVALIHKLDMAEMKMVLAGLTPLKAGRPKQDK